MNRSSTYLLLGTIMLTAACGEDDPAISKIYHAPDDGTHSPELDGERSIVSLQTVPLGGEEQWVLIRGQDQTKPVYLFLHGGPGSGSIPWAHWSTAKLEEHFVVVHWDQRGAGKSYHPGLDPESMTIERFISDAHELVLHLKERFGQDKIFLAGNSWGTILGALLVNRYPEDFHAYIGISQSTNIAAEDTKGYEEILVILEAVLADTSLSDDDRAYFTDLRDTLVAGPPPPWSSVDDFELLDAKTEAMVALGHGTYHDLELLGEGLTILQDAPEYTEEEKQRFFDGEGDDFSYTAMFDELAAYQLTGELTRFEVPVYIVAGAHDLQVPTSIQQEFFDEALDAPRERFFLLDESAHAPMYEQREEYQDYVVTTVLAESQER